MEKDYTEDLQELLRKLFQFNATDLDFGIYRIMNQRRDEIEKFIRKDLIDSVEEELEKYGFPKNHTHSYRPSVKKRLQATTLESFSTSSAEINSKEVASDSLELENDDATFKQHKAEIFSHIYYFFSRYYDNGDFISLQRFSKNQKYAIPYNGEEVMLHWANKDQYFIKTAKNFQNYTFKDEGKTYTIHFRISNAQMGQNNNKDENRYFFLMSETEIETEDGTEVLEPTSYDSESKELTIFFEYRGLKKGEEKEYGTRNTQDKILDVTENKILSCITDSGIKTVLTKSIGENKNFLRKNLNRYVRENNTDFFIHKDLKGFLTRELDFYIKNEIFDLDDILEVGNKVKMENYVGRVKIFKTICLKIIDFLSQIEEFQKKLFEKKKFVIDAEYCMTVDNVPESLYPEILWNKAQLDEWEKLYNIRTMNQKNLSDFEFQTIDLKANPYLVIDTKFFDQSFKDRLFANFDDLDEATSGLMINSENWQALNLLLNKYSEKVKCIYIDPPYNIGNDGFLYKDNFQHSSWLCMTENRLFLSKYYLSQDGVIFVSIDENEQKYLEILLQYIFNENYIATFVWEAGRKNDSKLVSISHEYMLCFVKNKELLTDMNITWRVKKEGIDEIYKKAELLKKEYKNDYVTVSEKLKEWFKGLPDNHPSKRHKHYNSVDERDVYFPSDISWPGGGGPKYEVLHPITNNSCKVPSRGWMYPTIERMQEAMEDNRVHFGPDESKVPCSKTYLRDNEEQAPNSVFYTDGRAATKRLRSLMGDDLFTNPKDEKVIMGKLKIVSDKKDLILDFFAGSGTTAHAVLNLNKEDKGERKYILVEMGEYFSTIMKPRIQKVMYSNDWKDGKPQSKKGQSHIFKYLTLEQYEDTLNNIEFEEKGSVQRRLDGFSDYMLHYMLDFETIGSPCRLNITKLKDPFNFTLKVSYQNELREQVVDLIETFNYLLGIHVKKVKTFENRGTYYRVVYGFKTQGEDERKENTVVLWRCTEGLNLKDDKDFIEGIILPEMGPFSKVYINSDFAVEGAFPIEPTFSKLMGA